jgi:pyridoxamine--pyruvate transaminase
MLVVVMIWHPARGNIRLLMTPGPVECSPRVLEALSRPQIYHYYPSFVSFFEDTLEKLRKVYQTKEDVLILQGEGVLGLEAAVANVVNPGDRVLVCDSGPFGKWFSVYVKNYKAVPVEVSVPYDEIISVEAVKEKLDTSRDIKALTVVHCETPAGILNPVAEICREAHKLGIVTIVDAVASLGGVDIRPDEWGIDICICASQKCISSPPGLTTLSLSQYAWDAIERKREPIRNSYLSLLDWRETWKVRRFPYTPFTAEIFAFNEALSELLEEGLAAAHARHRRVAEMCRASLKRLGLSLWPKSETYASDTVTAFRIPQELDEARIVSHMADKHGILIGGGYGETKGKVLRIGHMGYQATEANVVATVSALEETLTELQKPVNR